MNNVLSEERRATGPLFAFIDLLFLLVAFLVLVLFFVQFRKSEAQVKLEQVQEKLAVSEEERSAIEKTLETLTPLIEQFTLKNNRELERRRAREAREIRRRRRTTVKVEYRIEKGGGIEYEGRRYTLEAFKKGVIQKLRKDNWIAFRAYAAPETAFGTVVQFRRDLLESSGEFDTYWDNLTQKR